MSGTWRHICVDMQRMFAEDTPWHMPWMETVSPQIVEVTSRFAGHTIFTRFMPPQSPDAAFGQWQDYYEKWWMMTRDHLPPELFDVVPELGQYLPPARVFDKATYSPWIDGRLHNTLQQDGVDTLVITGGESDVCVLATALNGIDLGYRVVVLKDAICSSADETYDASLTLLGDRFSVQMQLMTTDEFLTRAIGEMS